MRGSFTIARVRGIRIRLHFTFLLVLPLIALGFAQAFVRFRGEAAASGALVHGSPYLWGVLIAVALFASVLVHELAHSLYAQWRGGEVKDITLLMIGGISQLTRQVRSPRDEALMALIGPITSLVLGAGGFLVYFLLGPTPLHSLRFAAGALGGLNLMLGVFNLLPAFPMDGGRVLRGALTGRLGLVRATQVAATLGKVFAVLFAVASFAVFNFFLLIIAFFIYVGAEAEASQVIAQTVLGNVKVADLLQPAPPVIAPETRAEDALARMVALRQLALLVGSDEALTGVIDLDDLRQVSERRRTEVPVSELAHPARPVPSTSNVWDALRLMSSDKLPLVPVVDEGKLVGVLDHDGVARGLRLYELQRRTASRRWPASRPTSAVHTR